MDKYDALIVGAGPAGSTLARCLRQSGMNVLLWDKQEFPRDKTCAGWVTPAVLETLQLDPRDYADGRVLQPIHGFRIACMGGRVAETGPAAQPISYGIRRCEFDHYLVRRSGVEQRLGAAIREIRRERDGWLVNDRLRARLLIGAGGHFCPVARQLGADLGRAELIVAAQEAEFEIPPPWRDRLAVREDTPELYFCSDLKGYGWLFRKGGYLNIGLGREDNHRLSEHLEAFCGYLERSGRIPGPVPGRFKGHAYLLYPHSARALIAEQALLIGDAAGLAYAQSGEGIRPAVESARLAAQTIVAADGDYTRQRLSPYQQAMFERFGRRGDVPAAKPASRLKQAVARQLLASAWFARRVVVDRWFLHREMAALA